MGCSKNLVDSEALTRLLLKKGYRCNFDPKRPQGEYVVVNTCGFIEDAKQESIDTILELIEQKNSGKIGYLYVMGCLSQRYLNQLEEEIPEVDKYFGKFNLRIRSPRLTIEPKPLLVASVKNDHNTTPSSKVTAKCGTPRSICRT